MKYKTIVLILVLFSFALVITPIKAEEKTATGEAKKLNLVFPIKELGNCRSTTECKTYCDQEANRTSCISFAMRKGFYKKPEPKKFDSTILEAAKEALGCDSEAACKEFCSQPENHKSCQEFAKAHNLGPRPRSQDGELINKLQREGSGSGQLKGPGGCTTPESCKAYCQTHLEECKRFSNEASKSALPRPKPPEGTKSAKPTALNGAMTKELEVFCKENPTKCAGFKDGKLNTAVFCKDNSEECYKLSNLNKNVASGSATTGKVEAPKPPTFIQPDLPKVQGVSTQRSIFQIILDWFRG